MPAKDDEACQRALAFQALIKCHHWPHSLMNCVLSASVRMQIFFKHGGNDYDSGVKDITGRARSPAKG